MPVSCIMCISVGVDFPFKLISVSFMDLFVRSNSGITKLIYKVLIDFILKRKARFDRFQFKEGL